jgi:HK97 family phage major capsid protein
MKKNLVSLDLQKFAYISRNDADALIPEEVSKEIRQNVPQKSAIMTLARRLPDMNRNQLRMPVLSGLATAYFVNGDTGAKQTANIAWKNKFINAAEMAVIIPIPEAVLSDADYDIWGEVRPRVEEAMGVTFDQAVLYGTNAPSDWPDDILTGATSAGHLVTLGTGSDIYDDIMAEGGTISLVEEDGFLVTGHVAALTMRARLRGLRDINGMPLFNRTVQETTRYELDGSEVVFPRNGGIDPAQSLMFSGDWSQLVFAIRQDISFKILTEAVIQNTDGSILYNLAQQDMVALRVVMRLGWELPNPINRVNQDEDTRYPFSVLIPAGS